MQVINSLKSRLIRLPIHSGTDVPSGTLLIKGPTAATDLGTAIVAAANNANNIVGMLAEPHIYSVNGSALVAGAQHSAVISGATGAAWFAPQGGNSQIFPSRQIEVCTGLNMARIDYDLTGVQVTNSSGTTVTVGSLEDNIDTSFLYASAGEAIGQLRFVDTAAAGSCTTAVAFTTMTAAGYIVKVLPLLHTLFSIKVNSTTVSTKFDNVAAAGTGRFVQVERHILRNGNDEMLDPYTHGNLSGLSSLNQFALYGVVVFSDTIFQPIA